MIPGMSVDRAHVSRYAKSTARTEHTMTSTNQLPCTAECPKYPGLVCHLVGGHSGNHFSMGESWGSHVDKGEQGINLPPDQQRWTGTQIISDATLDEISRVARQRAAADLSAEGTDLYGTRAIPQNGQPVHDRCGQPLRWSTAYDEPHWVHTSAAAVMACPPVRGSL